MKTITRIEPSMSKLLFKQNQTNPKYNLHSDVLFTIDPDKQDLKIETKDAYGKNISYSLGYTTETEKMCTTPKDFINTMYNITRDALLSLISEPNYVDADATYKNIEQYLRTKADENPEFKKIISSDTFDWDIIHHACSLKTPHRVHMILCEVLSEECNIFSYTLTPNNFIVKTYSPILVELVNVFMNEIIPYLKNSDKTMQYMPVYSDKFISVELINDRVTLFDSDHKYIDYLFEFEGDDRFAKLQSVVDDLQATNKNQKASSVVDYIKSWCFDIVDCRTLSYDSNKRKTQLQKLYDEFGEEYVNRIGNIAVILKE